MGRDYSLSIAAIAAVLAAAVLAAAGCSGGKVSDKAAAPRQATLKITQFYTSPDVIAPGETVLLCYGVENAERVSIDPPVENVRPVLSRCVPAKPAQTTTYRLTAAGAGGTVTAAATVTVSNRKRPSEGGAAGAKPSSLSLFADHKTVKRGQPVVLCYQASGAAKVDIAPRTGTITLPVAGCITEQPAQTTTYVLTAEFGDRRQEKQEIEVRVE